MNRTKCTESLLRSVATHLSGRVDCRGITYTLCIDEQQNISFSPNIQVFPSRYRRKQEDKVPVIDHILFTHFSDIFLDRDASGKMVIAPNTLVPGTYEYQPSFDNKRRRWVRIK